MTLVVGALVSFHRYLLTIEFSNMTLVYLVHIHIEAFTTNKLLLMENVEVNLQIMPHSHFSKMPSSLLSSRIMIDLRVSLIPPHFVHSIDIVKAPLVIL